jgi:hypothetical protein
VIITEGEGDSALGQDQQDAQDMLFKIQGHSILARREGIEVRKLSK